MEATKAVVLDIHCLYDNEMKLIVKELSMYDLNYHSTQHWIFKPPENLVIYCEKTKITNQWVTRNQHHIPWEAGDVQFEELENILENIFSSFGQIFVKGRQKVDLLKSFVKYKLPQFINLEILGCPKLEILLEPMWMGSHCFFHNFNPTSCTTYKMKSLVRWFLTR